VLHGPAHARKKAFQRMRPNGASPTYCSGALIQFRRIDMMSTSMTSPVIAIIPARGGSKRLPGKNVRLLNGLPLITWTIRAALKSGTVDRVILSSEDPEIMKVALAHGCEVPFCRPIELASDTTSTVEVILQAIDCLNIKSATVVVLQPTSPLRLPEDIDDSVKKFYNFGATSCVTVTSMPKSESFYARMSQDGFLTGEPVFRDIGNQKRVLLNGAVYVVDAEHLRQSGSLYGPKAISHLMPLGRSIDIDTQEDFDMAEALWPYSWGRLEDGLHD
jgi:CMP-N,N'-diacetyllegionaminic acid synthase